jgi:cytochrome d ubiquinol oxidase subunit II
MARWFGWPTLAYSATVPLLMAAATALFWAGLRRNRDLWPFLATLAGFALCYAGLGVSFYPNLVPPALSIADAAAPDASLGFLLVGALMLLPMILGYTAYSYWVFRGKIRPDDGYH